MRAGEWRSHSFRRNSASHKSQFAGTMPSFQHVQCSSAAQKAKHGCMRSCSRHRTQVASLKPSISAMSACSHSNVARWNSNRHLARPAECCDVVSLFAVRHSHKCFSREDSSIVRSSFTIYVIRRVLIPGSKTRMVGLNSQMRGLQSQVSGSTTGMDRHCKSDASS